MPTAFSPRVHTFVLVMAAAALAVLVANTYALLLAPVAPTWELALGTVAFVAVFIVLERAAVSFLWRGHRITTAITECAVYLGLALLSPQLVVILVPLARAAVHFAARRPPIKGVFNVSHQTIAAGLGAATHLAALTFGWPPAIAALLATIVYSITADALVAALFSVMESVPVYRVYAERFLYPNGLAIAVGLPAGVAFLALYSLHPFALLAAIPMLVVLMRHTSLQARADRELGVRRRLASEEHNLVGIQDEERIAKHVLKTTLDLIERAGRVRLSLSDGRSWEDAPLHVAATQRGIASPLLGREGAPIGTLEAWERPMKQPFGEDERALLEIVAAKAAHAIESARALAQVAAQRDLIARQEKLSALGTLLAGVAHEVNNPLSYMRLRLQLTRTEAEKAAKSADAAPELQAFARKMLDNMDTIHRGVERLAGLSHSLKVVARPGDGQRHPTDLNEVVNQVMTLLRAAEKHVVFDVELATTLPLVNANAAELHQVVLNLVKNASEALKDAQDARIRVETRSENGSALVVVQDNGPGIPDDVKPRLFTPFFTTKDKGTGLGLSISHQIVAAHGGDLGFDSSRRGTTFTVRLPLPSA